MVDPMVILAHELGGAQGYRRGNKHHYGTLFDRGPAIRAEDAARTIVGCPLRHSHDNESPNCILVNQ